MHASSKYVHITVCSKNLWTWLLGCDGREICSSARCWDNYRPLLRSWSVHGCGWRSVSGGKFRYEYVLYFTLHRVLLNCSERNYVIRFRMHWNSENAYTNEIHIHYLSNPTFQHWRRRQHPVRNVSNLLQNSIVLQPPRPQSEQALLSKVHGLCWISYRGISGIFWYAAPCNPV